MNGRFGDLKGEMNGRFGDLKGEMDRRFDDLRDENREAHAAIGQSIADSENRVLAVMNQRFEDTGKRMDEMSKRIDDLRSTELIQDLRKHFGAASG